MDKRYLLIGLVFILFWVACTVNETEQESDLLLPTAVIQEATPSQLTLLGATATFQPTAVIFPDTPTPPVVVTQAPQPTATPLPPTLIPSDVIVETENRPYISQDLLFIGDGDLKKWSRRDGRVTTLLYKRTSGRQTLLFGNVYRFAINAEGTVAVAARAIPADSMSSELWWVDTNSGQRRQLVATVPGLIDMSLSPDGRSLLYIASDADNLFWSGTVYQLDLVGDDEPMAVGPCTDMATVIVEPPVRRACLGVLWTRDSQNMLWSDANGIWLRHVAATEATLILPATAMSEEDFLPLYHLREWSLNGRYLMLSVTTQLQQAETAVLDLATNKLLTIPETLVSEDKGYVEVDWMQDGRLFVIREQDEQGQVAPSMQLWRLNDGQLILEETTALTLPPHTWLQDAVHFITGRYAFTLIGDDPLLSGLYLMASSNEQPQRVNGLPYIAGETTWLYDNAGAIMTMPGRDDSVVFLGVEPGRGIVYEIRPFLGHHTSQFAWLTP